MSRHAQLAWLDLISGGDTLVIETVKRQIAHLKSQLAGPAPTALEALLVDQVLVTHLAANYSEAASAKPGKSSAAEGNFWLRRAESTQKRHLAAMRTLANLRALLPKGLAPSTPPHIEDVARATGKKGHKPKGRVRAPGRSRRRR